MAGIRLVRLVPLVRAAGVRRGNGCGSAGGPKRKPSQREPGTKVAGLGSAPSSARRWTTRSLGSRETRCISACARRDAARDPEPVSIPVYFRVADKDVVVLAATGDSIRGDGNRECDRHPAGKLTPCNILETLRTKAVVPTRDGPEGGARTSRTDVSGTVEVSGRDSQARDRGSNLRTVPKWPRLRRTQITRRSRSGGRPM